jgi:DNA-binding Lrp family transcriptional regulator
MQLDRTDRAIVARLMQDARQSNKELAAAVGIAPSTLSERLRRLEDSGVFRGFHADVERRALQIGLEAMIAIRLRNHTASEVATLKKHASAMPEVVGVYHVTGANDFLVHVAVRDSDHLRDLAVSGFTTLPEISHIETSLIFDHIDRRVLPDYGDRRTI